MEKKIRKILKEVYLIDKDLKAHEKELVKLVQELLYSKPENKIDRHFVKELRLKLVEKSKLLKEANHQNNMFNTLFNKRFAFIGALILVCLAAVSIFFLNKNQNNNNNVVIQEEIKSLGKNAFGDLSFAKESQGRDSEVLGFGGGGGGQAESMLIPAPDMVNYKYVYRGENFEITDSHVTVYRKSNENSFSDSLSNVLGGIKLKGVDLSKFKNAKISTIEISEDREFGYSVYIDSRSGTMFINSNWEKWPTETFDSRGSVSGQEAISIADSFISEYGINMKEYGEGEIVSNGRWLLNENPTVVYPLKINGQIVYDEGGQKYGIYANINSFQKKVMNLGSLSSNLYESSNYDVAVSKEQAIEIAEKGGIYGGYIVPEPVKTVEVELGAPTIEIVKIWRMSDNKTGGEDLFVPSLVFPIINSPGEYFYRTNVVVPLVGGIGNDVRIMPMAE